MFKDKFKSEKTLPDEKETFVRVSAEKGER